MGIISLEGLEIGKTIETFIIELEGITVTVYFTSILSYLWMFFN
jgi:hypothetical protein